MFWAANERRANRKLNMSEFIFGRAACMPSATVKPVATELLPQPEVLQAEQLSAVAGGINPQPLPPCRKLD